MFLIERLERAGGDAHLDIALFLGIPNPLGYQVGLMFVTFNEFLPFIGLVGGFAIAALIILAEFSLRRISIRGLSAGVFGLLFGLLLAKLLNTTPFL